MTIQSIDFRPSWHMGRSVQLKLNAAVVGSIPLEETKYLLYAFLLSAAEKAQRRASPFNTQ